MKTLSQATWTITALLGIALPAAAAPPEDVHHAQAQAVAPQGVSPQQKQRIQGYMSAMRSQMSKLHQATDPKERERLLQEHMQTMQSMLAVMQSMGGGMMSQMMGGHMGGHMGSGQSSAGQMGDMLQMQNRMDMMQMMMQQMMEQMQGQMSAAGDPH